MGSSRLRWDYKHCQHHLQTYPLPSMGCPKRWGRGCWEMETGWVRLSQPTSDPQKARGSRGLPAIPSLNRLLCSIASPTGLLGAQSGPAWLPHSCSSGRRKGGLEKEEGERGGEEGRRGEGTGREAERRERGLGSTFSLGASWTALSHLWRDVLTRTILWAVPSASMSSAVHDPLLERAF